MQAPSVCWHEHFCTLEHWGCWRKKKALSSRKPFRRFKIFLHTPLQLHCRGWSRSLLLKRCFELVENSTRFIHVTWKQFLYLFLSSSQPCSKPSWFALLTNLQPCRFARRHWQRFAWMGPMTRWRWDFGLGKNFHWQSVCGVTSCFGSWKKAGGLEGIARLSTVSTQLLVQQHHWKNHLEFIDLSEHKWSQQNKLVICFTRPVSCWNDWPFCVLAACFCDEPSEAWGPLVIGGRICDLDVLSLIVVIALESFTKKTWSSDGATIPGLWKKRLPWSLGIHHGWSKSKTDQFQQEAQKNLKKDQDDLENFAGPKDDASGDSGGKKLKKKDRKKKKKKSESSEAFWIQVSKPSAWISNYITWKKFGGWYLPRSLYGT